MVSTHLQNGFAHIVSKAGRQIKIDYLTPIYDDVYDEVAKFISSGTVWTSGVIMSLNQSRGSTDSVLFEQGKLIDNDKKLFVNGSLLLTGSDLTVKIQLGSPTGETYSTIGDIFTSEIEGENIYKKAYIRRLTTGSLINE